MRATQAGLYSTGKGSGFDDGDDDLLDAMMVGMESDFAVATPTEPASSTPKLSELSSSPTEPKAPSDSSATLETLATSATSSAVSDTHVPPAAQANVEKDTAFTARPVDIEKRLKALCKFFLVERTMGIMDQINERGKLLQVIVDLALTRLTLHLFHSSFFFHAFSLRHVRENHQCPSSCHMEVNWHPSPSLP